MHEAGQKDLPTDDVRISWRQRLPTAPAAPSARPEGPREAFRVRTWAASVSAIVGSFRT